MVLVDRPRQVIKKFNFVYIFINFSCTPPLEILRHWRWKDWNWGLNLRVSRSHLPPPTIYIHFTSSVFNKHGKFVAAGVDTRIYWVQNRIIHYYCEAFADFQRLCGCKQRWRKWRRWRWEGKNGQITSKPFLITAAIWFWQLLSFVPHLFSEWGSDWKLCRGHRELIDDSNLMMVRATIRRSIGSNYANLKVVISAGT